MKRFRVNFWFRFDEPIFVLIWIKYWRHWKNQFFGLIFDWFLVNRFRLNSSLTESNQFWSIQAPILTNFWLIDAIRSWSIELNISPIYPQFVTNFLVIYKLTFQSELNWMDSGRGEINWIRNWFEKLTDELNGTRQSPKWDFGLKPAASGFDWDRYEDSMGNGWPAFKNGAKIGWKLVVKSNELVTRPTIEWFWLEIGRTIGTGSGQKLVWYFGWKLVGEKKTWIMVENGDKLVNCQMVFGVEIDWWIGIENGSKVDGIWKSNSSEIGFKMVKKWTEFGSQIYPKLVSKWRKGR